MSQILNRLAYFRQEKANFSGKHGIDTRDDRSWENSYRLRQQNDKIVRSTHGVNCTGSCSWKIYVKNGLVTWEIQQTDYPRTRPGIPNHEPRGCPRGASYSWYLYSANRLKYPMVRGHLLRLWQEARAVHKDPVDAWASIVEDAEKARSYKKRRGMGGFVRSNWDEVTELIAAANIYTIKTCGPDRVAGFSPIPAMSMVSYAAGTRYLSLIGGTCISFYDWYCDLPPSSPQTWGEQTDVPESADWFSASFIIMWGSNVPQTRSPDAHFMTEVRYRGTKTVTISPDYSEAAKFGDLWLHPKEGTDAALALAMGHVILREWYIDGRSEYFEDYLRRYTDMPVLVRLEQSQGRLVAGRTLRASDLAAELKPSANNPEWKTLAWDEVGDSVVVPHGSIGFRWGADAGKWNLEQKNEADGRDVRLQLSFAGTADDVASVAFPYFGGARGANPHWSHTDHPEILERNVPARRLRLASGEDVLVTTVFDLTCANYGVDRGLGGTNVAKSFDDDVPCTPAWQERITGVPRDRVITVARQFAETAHKTEGAAMVIIGAGVNHWYHMDMTYRGVINMLMLCGCIGKPGGGWAHYVGQEKLRPQSGWSPLAFAGDWLQPPRQMNGTSYFYLHTNQWRYEKLGVNEILSPLANPAQYTGHMIDFNVRAERMGWLPSSPQFSRNPLHLTREAEAAGKDPGAFVVDSLKEGQLAFASEDPDGPNNYPRNLFIWRANVLGASGKGKEYFLKYLLGAENQHGVLGLDLGKDEMGDKPEEVQWRDPAVEGKLDLLVTLDFRMSTTCMYSDVVLPTATWYEKDDLNTSDMHPFIHPLSKAVDPAWESRSDWDIYKCIAKKFSELSVGHLGVEQDLVSVPLQHDSPAELGQALDVRDWKRGDCDPVPGKTMPFLSVVERDYPNTYRMFTSLGPRLEENGNASKGIKWDTKKEVAALAELNRRVSEEGVSHGRPRIDSAIDACETILMLAPETNGEVAVKAWSALSKSTGRDHTHLVSASEHEKIRFRDLLAQPRKILTSPTWSGIESEHVSYTAGYTNVHELIPWRTLTGRQQFYQDHPWMRAFGEELCVYKPPVNTKTIKPIEGHHPNGNPELVLSFNTPHQKWGIHSTYSDNLIMLTLARGGPVIWMSEVDAQKAEIEDNDWIEAYNINGAITARAIVSQRVPPGLVFMYHGQERIVHTPGSEMTGRRGGIHNSVTRVVLKPTHMIGGYAQLAYAFNYYGTVGSNRDEFVIVRRMDQVDWLGGAPQHILKKMEGED
ncbi:nitrate reductase subunit alpha [Gilvimarinus sp. F26214L]|uniref:nitrate reductase subunit alpha n=1 Tax=Gilvimarinus sp. DZF01 TaxID=3461371 RepID=UPI00404651BD